MVASARQCDVVPAVDFLFGYTGKALDDVTGLLDYRHRWYDPVVGRFLSEDPIADDINPYRYVGNDPINNIDPYGLCSTSSSSSNWWSNVGSSIGNVVSSWAQPYIGAATSLYNSYIEPYVPYASSAYNAVSDYVSSSWSSAGSSSIVASPTSSSSSYTAATIGGSNVATYAGPTIQALPPQSWWQATTDWISDVWNGDFIDEYGGGARPNDDMFTGIVRRAVHQNVKPIGSGVWGATGGAAISVGSFAYDNSIGIPIHGLDQTMEANQQRLATLQATGEMLANWDQVPDYQAGRIVQSVAAGAAASYGTGLAAGRAISVLGDSLPSASVGRFSQLREASMFLRDEAGITSSAYRRQVIESFGADMRVEAYQGQAYQYSGIGGTSSRYLTTGALSNPIQELALPPSNPAILLQQYNVGSTRALMGTTAPQNFGFPLRGGAQQIFVPSRSVLKPTPLLPGP